MTRDTLEHGGKSESEMESTEFNDIYGQSPSDIDRGDQYKSAPQDGLTQPDLLASVDRQFDQRVIEAVESNSQLLHQLLEQFSYLQEVVTADQPPTSSALESQASAAEISSGTDQLYDQIDELNRRIEELEQQNSDLASQVASTNVREVVSGNGSGEALSWEDRKQLILEQMEADTFDAEAFVSDLQPDSMGVSESEPEGPCEFVERLSAELERLTTDLASREEEVHELRCLLDDQSQTHGSGIAVGAAAIAGLIDEDDLVVQERERLRVLQAEWEEKFRQGEIEASLERAKLSRERQEIAKIKSDLEERLEQLRRESQHIQESGGGTSRKWLAKLGLSDDRD